MISSHFTAPVISLSLLDRAVFTSISVMSVFALFSPIFALGH